MLIEKKAREGGFEEFRAALARSVFGVVFTAHPTFSISLELARILAELATGQYGRRRGARPGGT